MALINIVWLDRDVVKAMDKVVMQAKMVLRARLVAMQAKVEIQMLFTTDISAYTAKATMNGTEVPVVIDTETMGAYGWTLVRVAIGAANMRDTYSIALYDAAGKPVTEIYHVSVEAYGQEQLEGTYNDVVVAMMRYGDSVAAL